MDGPSPPDIFDAKLSEKLSETFSDCLNECFSGFLWIGVEALKSRLIFEANYYLKINAVLWPPLVVAEVMICLCQRQIIFFIREQCPKNFRVLCVVIVLNVIVVV